MDTQPLRNAGLVYLSLLAAVELKHSVVYVHDIIALRTRESLPPPGHRQQTICKFSSDVVARQPAFSMYRCRSAHGCRG